jgi:hypothetical protein
VLDNEKLWWLIWNTFVRHVVASDKAPNGALLHCRLVVLSLTKHTKLRIVVWRVVAMSHCCSPQIEGLAIYGGWFGTLRVALSIATTQPILLSTIVLSQATTRQSAKRRVVALSSYRPVSSEARQSVRCRVARYRNFVLSLGLNANPSIWTVQQCDIATTRRTTTRRLAFIVSDRTTRRKSDNAPFGALSCCH